MARNKDKKMYGVMLGVIIILALAIFGLSFSLVGESSSEGSNELQTGPVVQCSKDFERTVTFVARNDMQKGTSVNNVTYKVWKVLDEIKVPQPDSTGTLTVGYNEKFEVVAMAEGYKDVVETFEVDTNCNGPTDTVFYMTALPSSLDATIESNRITGPNSPTNRIDVNAEVTRSVKATFNGEIRTSTKTIIVLDADRNEFTIDSSLNSAPQPEEHSTITNYRSYTYDLGVFDGSKDVVANFLITGDKDLVAGDYNITYTIYQYQTGYINDDSGEYAVGMTIEGNREVLLPTFNGNIYVVAE